MSKYRETDDEAAEKIEMVIGQLMRAKAVKKAGADMAKAAAEFAKNNGLCLDDIKYAMKHMDAEPDAIDDLFEEEDNGLRERRHVLDVLRHRKTPLEKMIAKAAAGMAGPGPDVPPSPPAGGGGGTVTPLHKPGRA